MEKINVAEILKDCPKGMELDCVMYDNVTFEGIKDVGYINILIKTPNGVMELSKSGCYHVHPNAKCVIFPKGKTTWEGFQRPFKDGDVVATLKGNQIFIFKEDAVNIDNRFSGLCYLGYDIQYNHLFKERRWQFNRHATEEEKQKLFDAIKANGYKWNAETKTLEKLIVPKFKVGDRVKKNKDYISGIVTEIYDDSFKVTYDHGGCSFVQFHYQSEWELVTNKFDITTLKPFESRILVRSSNDDKWRPAIFGFTYSDKYYIVGGFYWEQCIPYESNKHLLGTTNNCDTFYKTWE